MTHDDLVESTQHQPRTPSTKSTQIFFSFAPQTPMVGDSQVLTPRLDWEVGFDI